MSLEHSPQRDRTGIGLKSRGATEEADKTDDAKALLAKLLWRFSDLKALGIAEDRATLRRWMAELGFPQPIVLGPNSLAWDAEETRQWVKNRPRGPAPQPPRAKAA